MKLLYFLVVLTVLINFSLESPKKFEADNGGFQPSHLRYYESDLPNKNVKTIQQQINATSKIDQKESRFGIPVTTYGNTGTGGYSNGMSYVMTPMKIDLGGIAIGALIGLGAVLIVPKLAHIFAGGYGYRSLETDIAPITDVLARIDNSLEQNNIDSSSCMQRIICSYVNEAQRNMQNGQANTVDQLISSLTNNNLFTYMLDGSSIKQAIDLGKKVDGENCATSYSKCSVTKDNILQIIDSILPV